jgi:hypothetical protein
MPALDLNLVVVILIPDTRRKSLETLDLIVRFL